ncbi:hypothetical protein AYO20_01677 [Fonsecaea nubica]|uniref:Uncharacterized protein n=1 Tax=Fonsecaea nubica TaxID=856822 RepID=A0A178DAZ8_9EURO|nr:hypothetical protein AYO20_01677 [Fonsecaea nubica]OAL38926.1 hypothetical protein AYO20_01677 [Fonsecaea nubica]
MAARIKSYFLAPNWDYQRDGPLALGNIISDPTDPVFTRLSGFDAAANVEIYHNAPEAWSHVESEMRAGRLGLFARFAEICGLGAAAEVSHASHQRRGYDMESIQTSYFVPTAEYLLQRLRDPHVRLWLEARGLFQSRSLYLITGVKIARGLVRYDTTAKKGGAQGEVDVDTTPIGVPVHVGVNGEYVSGASAATFARSTTEVVFGYQLRKITEKGTAGVKNDPFNRGAFLSNDDPVAGKGGLDLSKFELDDHDATTDDLADLEEPSARAYNTTDTIGDEECNVVVVVEPPQETNE